jgi:miniconductance mechanosensitive channel
MNSPSDWLTRRLEAVGSPAWVGTLILGAILGLVMWLSTWIARRILLRVVERFAARTATSYDDVLVEERVFHRLAHLAPAMVLRWGAPFAFAAYPTWIDILATAAYLYTALVAVSVVFALLNSVLRIYENTRFAQRLPIKPIVQVFKFVAAFSAALVLISTLFGRSPTVLLSGLGAFTAVLLLVFRDPILGLVAGIQLASNDMVRPGDWIEVPKYGADGEVTDVSLTTVSVQNWDKTISTLPTYSLLTDTFRNWRGMDESGGRRIKRSIFLDMSSVKFCDEELLQRLRSIEAVREHIDQKKADIASHNQEHGTDTSSPVNGRRLTNVGIFRAYLQAYLRQNRSIHDGMTFLVRQLQPTTQGLPIEIYVFSTDQRWVQYEAIQADIFDHVLAAVEVFDLRVYQEPTGFDLRVLRSS